MALCRRSIKHSRTASLLGCCSFSVVAVSRRGLGLESSRSEAVKVDTPLPKGWEEFWDPQTKRNFYKNATTQQVRAIGSLPPAPCAFSSRAETPRLTMPASMPFGPYAR